MPNTTATPNRHHEPLDRFLAYGYAPDDWIGLLAKSPRSPHIMQRIRPLPWLATHRVQAWLAALDRDGWDHYLTINALAPRQRSRARHAVSTIRHIMLDADTHSKDVVASLGRHGLPEPSYLIHSSSERLHVLWRVTGYSCDQAEALQRHLARELATDTAATSCAQLTRLIGSHNHKYPARPPITIEFRNDHRVYTPADFPAPPPPTAAASVRPRPDNGRPTDLHLRARRYVAAIHPAVTGQHGDQRTFQVCCRLVRGFALSDQEALDLLAEWNARCLPPWNEKELLAKLRHARQYGREPIGGLLTSHTTPLPSHTALAPATDTHSVLQPSTAVRVERPPHAASTHGLQVRACPTRSHAPRQCGELCPTSSSSHDHV